MFEDYFTQVAAQATVEVSKAALKKCAEFVQAKRPDIPKMLAAAEAVGDRDTFERVFKEAVGVIEAAAGSGAISIDRGTLVALRGVKFDHQHGRIAINRSVVAGAVLVTGGGPGATGKTAVSGTIMRAAGSTLTIAEGAVMTISGDAKLTQR